MAIYKKKVIIAVSKADGSFIGLWRNFKFEGFSKEINGGVGECVITLDKTFDYGGNDLLLGNNVEVRISDRDTLTGLPTDTAASRIIYRGYISLIDRIIDGGVESVVVHLLGNYTLLGVDYLKDAAQTTLYSEATAGLTTAIGSQSAADIGLMVRALIDRYRAETVNPQLNYDSTQVPDTGTTMTYRFAQKTYREALDKLKSLAPVGTYWYIDETGNLKFKAKPTTPTHKFIFGRHFNKISAEHSLEKVRNFILVWDGQAGGTYKHYQDADSIAVYGRRAQAVNDFGIDGSNAADGLGAKFIAENKDPEIKVICTIVDNNDDANAGYDIESIQPGDTCSFYGFNSGLSEILRDNMLITKVNYKTSSVEIEVEVVKAGLLDVQQDQGTAIADIGSGGLGVPESYT